MGNTVAIACLITGLVAGYIGYYYGQNAGRDSGYSKGYEKGYSDVPKNDYMTDFYKQQVDKLTTDYNTLVNDYNNLRSYYNASQYQARQPISCTSYSYGIESNFINTNCY